MGYPLSFINTSTRNLSRDEIDLIQKGLNFAITPRVVPTKEILASVEQGVRNLTEEDHNEVRLKVTGTLKQAKATRKQNLSSSQMKALKGLRTDHNILIIKVDKGNSTVL